jgi:hypothetical protein
MLSVPLSEVGVFVCCLLLFQGHALRMLHCAGTRHLLPDTPLAAAAAAAAAYLALCCCCLALCCYRYEETRGNLALFAVDYQALFVDTIGRVIQQVGGVQRAPKCQLLQQSLWFGLLCLDSWPSGAASDSSRSVVR